MTPDAQRTGPVLSLARRMRMTEGQLYSSAVALLAALLLSLQLGGVHGLPSEGTDLTAGPGLAPAPVPVPQLPTVAVGPPGPVLGPPPATPLPLPVPQAEPTSGSGPEEPALPSTGPSVGPTFATGSPSPAPSPCAAQPVFGPAQNVFDLLKGTSGGVLPTDAIVAALSQATGCRAASTPSPAALP